MNAPCTLFYVDDDIDDLHFFKEASSAVGQEVTLFSMGEDMMHTLHNPPPCASVVFIDLNMGGKNGYDLVKEIRQSEDLQHLPVVVYSTANDKSTITKCKKMGASMYLNKPTSMRVLKKAIKDVVSLDWKNSKPNDRDFVYRWQ